jgi:ribonuclease E
MSVIARTAGIGRSTEELQWDLNYLMQLWHAVEDAAKMQSGAYLIYQESSLVIRAIRDYFHPDIGELLIDTEAIFEQAQQFMGHVMPANVNRVKLYKDDVPLFSRFQIEHQIETAYARTVPLPAGGAIVIDHTEALVSVDVNSARATKGGDIETTAFNTNLEAADEVARQLRLRDLGGLIVIDFIDMESTKNQREVENRLRDALKYDRARVQLGKISRFGLMELSRQRLRPALAEAAHIPCPRCHGIGHIRGTESTALHILRIIQEESMKDNTAQVVAQVPVDVATFLLNEKRTDVMTIEQRFKVNVLLVPNRHLETPNYSIERLRHDELNHSEPLPLSFDLVKQPEIVDPAKQMKEEAAAAPRQEAMVKGITPAQPAPLPTEKPAPPVHAAASAAGAAGTSWLSRVLDWFRPGPQTTAASTAAKPQREERGAERNRDGRRDARSGDQRDRNRGDSRRTGEQRRDEGRDGRKGEQRDRNRGEGRGAETREGRAPDARTEHPRTQAAAPVQRNGAPQEKQRRDERRGDGTRPPREPREGQRPPREPREAREPREVREPREMREPREAREPREIREPREPREIREPREPREPHQAREPGEQRLDAAPVADGIEGEMLTSGNLASSANASANAAADAKDGGNRRRRGRRGRGGDRPDRVVDGENDQATAGIDTSEPTVADVVGIMTSAGGEADVAAPTREPRTPRPPREPREPREAREPREQRERSETQVARAEPMAVQTTAAASPTEVRATHEVGETREAPPQHATASLRFDEPPPAPAPTATPVVESVVADAPRTPARPVIEEVPPVALTLPENSGLVLVETSHKMPPPMATEDEPPRPKRARPPRAEIPSEPLEFVETKAGQTPPAN